jgi:phospholipid/cholesterol/gamma-HCH transport system ATP-binding protein
VTQIRIEKLHKRFGHNHVLRGITLNVRPGRTRVILGCSGSGKSVLLKLIIGLLKPDSGSILVDTQDITQLDGRELINIRRKFGMVFQQAALFDSMSVFDNVAFPLREHTTLSAKDIQSKVEAKLALVGLEHTGPRYPSELSGGMRKRVGLARAVILDPEVILYDEPTTGLDPLTTENVDQMILDAKSQLGITSIVISHDIGSALKVGDDIAVIHEGEIVADDSSAALRQSQHPFVKRFLETWYAKQ